MSSMTLVPRPYPGLGTMRLVPRVLLVEDEEAIASLMELYLRNEGYEVSRVISGDDALREAERLQPSLVVLDLMLPGMDGVEVCRRLREESEVPVLMVTARDGVADRILGLEVGADDYLPKPFDPRELVLRVNAIVRRVSDVPRAVRSSEPIELGPIRIDPARHELSVSGSPVRCTAREFALLHRMAVEPGVVFDRARLLEQVWGYDKAFDTRTVDAHVKTLRKKLGAAGELIETVRGVGYRVRDPR
jgi:DNA-binding response OmpR family regulator